MEFVTLEKKKIDETVKIFYRYMDRPTYLGGRTLDLMKFYAVRETPCGYWIVDEYEYDFELEFAKKRWVSKTGRKRFAYPTPEEALTSFIARKEKQVKILSAQLIGAKDALRLGKLEQEG